MVTKRFKFDNFVKKLFLTEGIKPQMVELFRIYSTNEPNKDDLCFLQLFQCINYMLDFDKDDVNLNFIVLFQRKFSFFMLFFLFLRSFLSLICYPSFVLYLTRIFYIFKGGLYHRSPKV